MNNEEIYREIIKQRWYKTNISEVLNNLGMRRVGIFGCGDVGRALSKELLNMGFNVTCFIDNFIRGKVDDLSVIAPYDLGEGVDIDAIIISLSSRTEIFNISRQLSNYYNGIIIDITSILYLCRTINYAELVSNAFNNYALDVIPLQLYSIANLKKVSFVESFLIHNHYSHAASRQAMHEFNRDSVGEGVDIHQYINNLILPKPDTVMINNILTNVDFRSEYVNVIGSKRYTTDVPEKYMSTIHLFGSSTTYGAGVEDKYTIASCLQRMLNAKNKGYYRIISHGIRGVAAFSEIQYNNILNLDLMHDGDTVIFIIDTHFPYICYNKQLFIKSENYIKTCFSKLGFKYYSTFDTLNEKHLNENIFLDNTHFSFRGSSHIAKLISLLIGEKNNSHDKNLAHYEVGSTNLTPYLVNNDGAIGDYIKSIKANNAIGKIGALVVNCNPFTYGHRYLIKKSLKEVDFLYIFVVEENESFFPFSKRIFLVKEGVKDLSNCAVVPSGKFIISTTTFPEYFQKDTLLNTSIDCSVDITIFARYISPALGITVRFVGEEPFCNITKQYNDTMSSLLPKYGIEFVMFKRLESKNEPISASNVRRLLKAHEYDKIKTLVPKTTFDYLMQGDF